MNSYYNDKDILDMFPLNYEKLEEKEQDRIFEEISCSTDWSIDRIISVYYKHN